jgi:hypothetical protein
MNDIERIETKLDRVLELLEKDCKKMSDHIDFVESIYETVKLPFNFMITNVKNIMYSTYVEPQICD